MRGFHVILSIAAQLRPEIVDTYEEYIGFGKIPGIILICTA
jgi:hypothetical protein